MACITPTHRYRRHLLSKKILPYIKPQKVLEIGCGTGDFSLELSRLGHQGLAIDIAAEAIGVASKKLSTTNIAARQADFFTLHDTYDAVFLFEVLEHLKEDVQALKKIAKLVRKNGLFILSVPAHQHLFGRDDEWGGHYRRYDRHDLVSKLDAAGFERIYFWSYGFPVFNFTRRVYNLLTSLQ